MDRDENPRHTPARQRGERARRAARSIPQRRGARRRVFSQNLLHDPAAIDAFVREVGAPELPGIEVGGGEGALTVRLAPNLPSLTVVELDPRFAESLRKRTAAWDHVRIEEQDILGTTPPNHPFVLIGNVPFAITAQIVSWALESPSLEQAVLITQREYARKRTGDYGRWTLQTVRTWPWWNWVLGPRIGREAFWPRPSVDAAVLRIERRARPLVPGGGRHAWEQAVATGFKGVGGSLFASLSSSYPSRRVARAFARAGVDRDQIVGYVGPDEWVDIVRELEGWPGVRPGSGGSGLR